MFSVIEKKLFPMHARCGLQLLTALNQTGKNKMSHYDTIFLIMFYRFFPHMSFYRCCFYADHALVISVLTEQMLSLKVATRCYQK